MGERRELRIHTYIDIHRQFQFLNPCQIEKKKKSKAQIRHESSVNLHSSVIPEDSAK